MSKDAVWDGAFVAAGHEVLFEEADEVCEVCGQAVEKDDEGASRGLYVWSRRGEVVYEEPLLCASCSTVLGMSALQRWEIEEEEG